ncbi:MAG: YncE family protein [Myxococcales bacterium]
MRPLLPAACLSVLAACGSRGGDYAAPLQSEGPLAAADFAVALDTTDGALIAIDPLAAQAPRAFGLPGGAHHLTLTPDGQTALVVAGGATAPSLVEISLARATLGRQTVIALPANPDIVNLSPDGRFALLTYDPAAAQAGAGQAVIDPNEAVIVDVGQGTATRVALGTDSPAPNAVSFAQPGQGGSQLCAVLFADGLAVLDLGAPSQVLRVPVRIQGGPAVAPLKALFSSFTQGQGYVYVLAAQSDDVIAVALSTAGGLGGSINFLAGGQGLVDIALPSGPPPPSTVLALYAGQPAAMQLDATGRVDLTIATPLTAPATQLAAAGSGLMLLWADPSSGGASQVALWQPSQGQVAAVQLDGPVQALSIAPSGTVAAAAVSATEPELAVLKLGSGSQGPALSASPLILSGQAIQPAFDPASGLLYFGEANEPFLARVDPGTLANDQVTLDAAPIGIGLTSGAVFAEQSALYGQLTAVPTASFTRTSAEVFPSYLITQEVDLVSGP